MNTPRQTINTYPGVTAGELLNEQTGLDWAQGHPAARRQEQAAIELLRGVLSGANNQGTCIEGVRAENGRLDCVAVVGMLAQVLSAEDLLGARQAICSGAKSCDTNGNKDVGSASESVIDPLLSRGLV